MSNFKKLMMTAAGGAGLNVEEVFSTYLYTGNGTSQTFTNGIDLDGEGGLVWFKDRTATNNHNVYDTERGANYLMRTNTTLASTVVGGGGLTSFNSNGFSVGSYPEVNQNQYDFASWTFRKAPKFFDIVSYTGNGTAGRTISHNLGSTPGMIIVKRTDTTGNWPVWHRGMYANDPDGAMQLNSTAPSTSFAGDYYFGNQTGGNTTPPTSSVFTVGADYNTNASGGTYVAYLFAHNDGDGEFGPTGDQDIIKCGSFNFPASGDVEVDLGWEPQWVLLKRVDNSSNWWVFDTMRGWSAQEDGGTLSSQTGGKAYALFTDLTNAEVEYDYGGLTSTGFKWPSNFNAGTSTKWIYMAIRRGPMAVPESASDVFAVEDITTTSTQATSGFPVDMFINGYGTKYTLDRLRGDETLATNSTDAEFNWGSTAHNDDLMDGVQLGSDMNGYLLWMWKRAPNFFDVVAYTGTGSARTVSHNLGVAPEMMWVKRRDSAGGWVVYHSGLNVDGDNLPETDYIVLQSNAAAFDLNTAWNDTAPSSNSFTVGTYAGTNPSGGSMIAYLFASLAGISKVGSYTGNGSTQTINCGFSSGARFVLIKRTDSTGDWYVWDAERGIVAANDPHLSLNTTAADVTTDDSVDPVSSGFAVNQVSATNINVSSASYIYYAIA